MKQMAKYLLIQVAPMNSDAQKICIMMEPICFNRMPILKKNCTFLGWKIRIKSDRQWYWYMPTEPFDNNLTPLPPKLFSDLKAVLPDKSLLPPLPIAHLNLIVAEAVWELRYA